MSLSEMIAVLDNTESSAELLLLLDAIAEVYWHLVGALGWHWAHLMLDSE